MLRVAKTPDDDVRLSPLLDSFARWHAVHATLQAVTYFVMLWAIVIVH